MKRILIILGICFLISLAAGSLTVVSMAYHGFSTRAAPGPVETELATSMRNMAIPSRYKSMRNPVAATPEVLREAMEHWADHCATCHANNGSGDTMFGKTLYPRPPDMRQRGTQALSDGELYYTIQNGIRLSGMPAFGNPGDNELDSWKLVDFIRHLPSLSESEQTEMEKMNPKTPDELQEEQEEENFLQNSSPASQPLSTRHHEKEPQ